MEMNVKKIGLSLTMSVSLLFAAGCSDVGQPTGTGTGGTPTTPGTVTYTMTLASDKSPVPAGGTASITATILANGVKDLTLSPSVNFTSTCVAQTKAALSSPATGAASIAVSTYTDKGCGTTDTIIATATVDGQSISQTLTLPVEILSMTLAAPAALVGGTTTNAITVTVSSGTTPYTSQSIPVTFSTTCVTMGTATITPSTFTTGGAASATYTDKGCGILDTVVATATVGELTISKTATMDVGKVSIALTAPTSLVAGESTNITVTVKSGTAAYTAAEVPVSFTSVCVAGKKADMPSTALTSKINGAATVTLTDKGCGIANDTIVATAQVGGLTVSTTASMLVKGFTLTVVPATTTLAGGATTSVNATVSNDNGTYTLQPAEVTFSSNCTSQGTATMTSPAFTSNGIATSTYVDGGCATTDTLQATAKLGAATFTDTATLNVQALAMTVTTNKTTLAAGEPATVTATLTSGTTALTTPVQVTFSSNCVTATKATMASSSFSDATGKATVTFTDDGCGPTIDTLTATAQVGGVTLTASAPMTVTGFSLALAPTINPLAGGGSTLVTATVSNTNGTYTLKPAEVTFTSNCVVQGTAKMTSPAFTSNGVAKSTYTDQGCATTDTLQATAKLGGATFTATTPLDVQTVAMTLVPALTTLPAGNTTTVTAKITSGGLAYTTPVVVNFSSNCVTQSKAAMASSMFTDVTGQATVNFTDDGCGPTLDALSATAVVGGVVLSAGTNLTIDPFTMTLVPSSATLTAGATAPVTATIWSGATKYAQAVPITFTSNCVAQTKATLDSPVYTSNGVAVSSYTDKGCAAVDNLIATATVGGASLSAATSIDVANASAGSISFVSATPSNIGIKGAGLTEASEVKFRVVSGTGIPLQGQTVTFTLDNTQGGITYSPSSFVSDATGYASTTVSSGTAATTVRVKATTGALQTQSDGLVISTGISDQDSFSLSASTLNPEAYDINGTEVTLNIYAADAFNNPVPDGSAIYFTTEGGQVTPSCLTTNGGCSVKWTSANPRPPLSHNGRITILATMVGEESFTDLNGNNYYDGVSYTAPDGITTEFSTLIDKPEAWRDDNENGVWDSNEVYRDFNSNGSYNNADSLYSGVLCNSGCVAAGQPKSIEVRQDIVLVMAESIFNFTFDSASYSLGGGPVTGYVAICGSKTDGYPPAGTTIAVVTTNGEVALVGGNTVPNAVPAAIPPSAPYTQCYIQAFTIKNDSSTTTPTGIATFTATTPGAAGVAGTTNYATITISDL